VKRFVVRGMMAAHEIAALAAVNTGEVEVGMATVAD
jgi:hypothetical protein